jgi:hypothetical protein
MPEPLPLRKVLGPGVIAAGIGLASGEFILWPYITSQVGLVFLWAAVLGVVTQFFINMEIERYTLATGETALTGYTFRENEGNLARWKGWWDVANKEQLVSFVAITILTIALMSLLAYSTVLGIEGENNISFLEAEGNVLMDKVGSWFGYLFWIIGATSLFAAALGIVDYTCRLVADVLKVSYLRENDTWSESRIYFALVWLLVLWSAVILLTIQSQPLILLIISASIGGFMMFVYSGLLILINRRSLPPSVRITGFRTGTMVWSVLLFGAASVIAISDQWDNIKELVGL